MAWLTTPTLPPPPPSPGPHFGNDELQRARGRPLARAHNVGVVAVHPSGRVHGVKEDKAQNGPVQAGHELAHALLGRQAVAHTSDEEISKAVAHTSDEEMSKAVAHTADEEISKAVAHTSDEEISKAVAHTADEEISKAVAHTADEEISKAVAHTEDEEMSNKSPREKIIIIIIKGHSLRRACLQPATNTQNSKPETQQRTQKAKEKLKIK